MSTLELPLDRFAGCLLGQAVGDALGAPFEGIPADYVFWVSGTVNEQLNRDKDELRYTDDTQMMISIAENLVHHGEIELIDLRQRFIDNYEPHRGYGQGARRIIEAAAQGGDWETLPFEFLPGGSFGNGAAMRAAPIGLCFPDDPQRVVDNARLSALPTHRHELGVEGARILALAVSLVARQAPFQRKQFYAELLEFCSEEEFRWQLRAASKLNSNHSVAFLGNSLPAHRSVVTAIACFTTAPDSYETVVAKAIALGDDTDTLAAMAGALCGTHLGYGAVPPHWVDRLENGAKGRDYLFNLAVRLHARISGSH